MISKEYTFYSKRLYDFDEDYGDKKILYFDIETTGFSRENNHIYLIGAAYKNTDGSFNIIQWFDDTGKDEIKILLLFREFLKNFDVIADYNGNSFDIPFVIQRGLKYGINFNFDKYEMFDLYKKIRPYKKLFKTLSLKQKQIEIFLDIDRDDKFDGGQLIEMYNEYISIKEASEYKESILNFLLLHNHDDMEGLVNICDILVYSNILEKKFEYNSCEIIDDNLIITAISPHRFKTPVFTFNRNFKYQLNGNKIKILLEIKKLTLKYFFENYKDYYYLPDEDLAIHKSVASFVDSSHKIKAKKDNCYTKKESFFCYQPGKILTPSFCESLKTKCYFFEATDSILDNYTNEDFNNLIFQILKEGCM